jgi:hypothetical protein
MLALFCLRLACGLAAALLLLPPAQIHPRFFRTHFLTILGLSALAAVFLRETPDAWLWVLLGAAMLLAFLGSCAWHMEGAPAGRLVIWITLPVAIAALLLAGYEARPAESFWLVADDLTSAALLGFAMTAMLIGHSYLMAPAMSLTPLYRSLAALGISLLLRIGVALAGLGQYLARPETGALERELLIWLGVRWLLGFVGPLILGWMAWETARIRSTQSATGILYVVVIFCFLGELTSLLLLQSREKVRVFLLERFDAALHGPHVQTERQHAAAQLYAALRIGRPQRQDRPGDGVAARGPGDALDCLPVPRMLPVAWNSHRLAQISRPDEQQIDPFERGDRFHFLHRVDVLDLNRDEGLSIGAAEILGHRQGTVSAIDAGAVDAAQAVGMKPGPADHVGGFGGAADLGGHDAARAGFQRTHHRRIIRGGQAHKGIDSHRAGGASGVLDLFDGQSGMFLIEPDRVEPSVQPHHLNKLRMA